MKLFSLCILTVCLSILFPALSSSQEQKASVPPTTRHPSVWEKPTEVTSYSALTWGLSYQQLWCAGLPEGTSGSAEVQGIDAKAAGPEALLVDAKWAPVALLSVLRGPAAASASVTLLCPTKAGMRILFLLEGKGDPERSSRWRGEAPSPAANPLLGSVVRGVRLRAFESPRLAYRKSAPGSIDRWMAMYALRSLAQRPLEELGDSRRVSFPSAKQFCMALTRLSTVRTTLPR